MTYDGEKVEFVVPVIRMTDFVGKDGMDRLIFMYYGFVSICKESQAGNLVSLN